MFPCGRQTCAPCNDTATPQTLRGLKPVRDYTQSMLLLSTTLASFFCAEPAQALSGAATGKDTPLRVPNCSHHKHQTQPQA